MRYESTRYEYVIFNPKTKMFYNLRRRAYNVVWTNKIEEALLSSVDILEFHIRTFNTQLKNCEIKKVKISKKIEVIQ